MIEIFTLICACVAAGAAIFSLMRAGKKDDAPMQNEMRGLRQEINATLFQFQTTLQNTLADKNKTQADMLQQLGGQQKERLEQVNGQVATFTATFGTAMEAMRRTLETRMDIMRNENLAKLDEMRKTVDEKLQTTLEKNLTESFKQVREQLDRVHQGLGEMQSLAIGVGDLKKVLTNVKTRGIFGEILLGNILEQFLTKEQYVANAQVKANSGERVEFAIRLPGRSAEEEVFLPIDSKFPIEDYHRLISASEGADGVLIEQISVQLENTARAFAKTISDKYICPPATTDFAILFVPTESLYAELLRRPGLFERLQHEHHVTLAGPTTLVALLNALQMGFRSLAIEKRSSEVWKVLGAVRSEFDKYGETVAILDKQLNTALGTIEKLGTRTRKMGKELSKVESLPESEASLVLGLDLPVDEELPEDVLHLGKKKA